MNQDYKKPRGSLLVDAMKLCARMSSAAIEMKMVMRLPALVEEYGQASRALREPAAVKIILNIDEELLLHARPSLHRAVLSAVDAAAEVFVGELDRDGWVQVLLVALDVADDPPKNVVSLDTFRSSARIG